MVGLYHLPSVNLTRLVAPEYFHLTLGAMGSFLLIPLALKKGSLAKSSLKGPDYSHRYSPFFCEITAVFFMDMLVLYMSHS
jgi:hypothetical protein